jgi:hypothetical protein
MFYLFIRTKEGALGLYFAAKLRIGKVHNYLQ